MASQQRTGKPNSELDGSFQQDLNPHSTGGKNDGYDTVEPGRFDQKAYDIQALRDRLETLSGIELRQIPVLKIGAKLRQGATYIDLSDAKRQEFTGMADTSVRSGEYIVPKDQVSYDIWNRLTNVG